MSNNILNTVQHHYNFQSGFLFEDYLPFRNFVFEKQNVIFLKFFKNLV